MPRKISIPIPVTIEWQSALAVKPETAEPILIYSPSNHDAPVSFGYWHPGNRIWYNHLCTPHDTRVTHWSRLPAPPKTL